MAKASSSSTSASGAWKSAFGASKYPRSANTAAERAATEVLELGPSRRLCGLTRDPARPGIDVAIVEEHTDISLRRIARDDRREKLGTRLLPEREARALIWRPRAERRAGRTHRVEASGHAPHRDVDRDRSVGARCRKAELDGQVPDVQHLQSSRRVRRGQREPAVP